MDTKHTPGPWIAPEVDTQTHGGDLSIESRTNRYANPRYVGRVYGGGRLVPLDEETKANARLIAAAPDLLEACKAFVRDRATCPTANGQDLETWGLMVSAIAKAEGRE